MISRFAPFVCLACLIGAWRITAWNGSVLHSNAAIRTTAAPEQLSADGIENLWTLPLPRGGVLYSGGQPEGDAGFQSLQKLGIRTILSVDGAPPDVAAAEKFGLRYVHLPISYDDVPEQQLIRMVQAVRALPGPVFVHCHHGKHRGPSAAVCIWRELNSQITADTAVDTIRAMGTAAKYRGLYRAVEREPVTVPVTAIDAAEFPTVTHVAPLAEQMVAIDLAWEHIQNLVKQAAPQNQDSLETAWTDFAERFRESARLLDSDSQRDGTSLNYQLAAMADFLDSQPVNRDDRSGWWDSVRPLIETRCAGCHQTFRD